MGGGFYFTEGAAIKFWRIKRDDINDRNDRKDNKNGKRRRDKNTGATEEKAIELRAAEDNRYGDDNFSSSGISHGV